MKIAKGDAGKMIVALEGEVDQYGFNTICKNRDGHFGGIDE